MLLLPLKLLAGAVLALAGACALAQAPAPAVAPAPGSTTLPAASAATSAATSAVTSIAAPVTEASRADDDTFLLLREAARQNDGARANALASRLPNYVLPAYVDYYRLKPRLRETPYEEIRGVLRRHEGSAAADRLRTDWLLELGRQRD